MYRCDCCKAEFSETDRKEVCYEQECGVASMFDNWNYGYVDICPECGSEDFKEVDNDEAR